MPKAGKKLSQNPMQAKIQSMMNSAEKKAIANKHEMIRVRAGWYMYHDGTTIWEITQRDKDDPTGYGGWWGGIDYYNHIDYLDPMPTLKSLKSTLR